MTVKDLIVILLDMDMGKRISIEYPTTDGKYAYNYSRYAEAEQAEQFEVKEYPHGIVIGVSE